MAASPALPGFSMQDDPYATITDLLVMRKNVFTQLRATGESSPDGVQTMGRQKSGHSDRLSRSASSSTMGSVASLSNTDDEANASRAPCEADSDKDAWDSPAPAAGKKKRVYNLCKNKRVRLRKFEAKTKEAILKNPFQHIDDIDIPIPPFLAETPDPKLVNMLKTRFLEFQQRVLAGENPDPSFRHPTRQARHEAASAAGWRDPSAKQRSKQENAIIWL